MNLSRVGDAAIAVAIFCLMWPLVCFAIVGLIELWEACFGRSPWDAP